MSEQAPGPRGSPHVPHDLADTGAAAPVLTAKTESWRSSTSLWHSGQCGTFARRTSHSNRCEQSRQMYSKMGIFVIHANDSMRVLIRLPHVTKLRLKPPRSFLSRGNGRGIPSERVDSGGARPFDSFVLSLSKDELAQDMLQPCQATRKGCPTATRSRLRQRAAVESITLLTRRRENFLQSARCLL